MEAAGLTLGDLLTDGLKEGVSEDKPKTNSFWRPFLAIAASVVIALTVFTSLNTENELTGLASVSPEMSETQDFFTATIREELKKLDAERSPLTEHIIYEAERQLKTLEEDYDVLKNDLKETGNDERIIYAMISNFHLITYSNVDMQDDVNINYIKRCCKEIFN